MTGSAFSLVGNAYFNTSDVTFQVSFVNPADASTVLAYEWYIDTALVLDFNNISYTGKVTCGNHKISVRLLTATGWTGIKSLSFTTCKVPTTRVISGPANVEEGDSAVYQVLQQFSDGSFDDLTAEYTFTSAAGGSFVDNTFTANPNNSFESVNIYADKVGFPQLSKQITIDGYIAKAGVLVIDFDNDQNLDVIGLIDNPGVTDNHVAAYTGQNKVPSAAVPAQALILASDLSMVTSVRWRFEFNVAKLVATYPSIQTFVFYLKGRSVSAGTISGSYSVKSDAAVMTMNGSAGSYMPSVTGIVDAVPPTQFTSPIAGGANGSYLESDLPTILRFEYNVPSKAMKITTGIPQITIPDFDFLVLKYNWLPGSGGNLDNLTGFENNGTAVDNIYVGNGQPSQTLPANQNPASSAYLWWPNDNASNIQQESVMIGMKAFITAFPASPNIVEAGLYAVWFSPPLSGSFEVLITAYKGGTMSWTGTAFANAGGATVYSQTISLNTLKTNQIHTPANSFKLGRLRYNRTSKITVIDIF